MALINLNYKETTNCIHSTKFSKSLLWDRHCAKCQEFGTEQGSYGSSASRDLTVYKGMWSFKRGCTYESVECYNSVDCTGCIREHVIIQAASEAPPTPNNRNHRIAFLRPRNERKHAGIKELQSEKYGVAERIIRMS